MMQEYLSRSRCTRDSRRSTPSVISAEGLILPMFCVEESGPTLNSCFIACAVLKSDCIANKTTQLDFHFLADAFSHTHGRNSPRLCTSNHSKFSITFLVQKLCQLSCLS